MSKINQLFILLWLALFCACTASKPPAGYHVPRRLELDKQAFGSYLKVHHAKGTFDGEFIGIRNDSIVVLNKEQLFRLPIKEVEGAHLIIHKVTPGVIAVGGVLGVFSTISNGLFLVLSMPPWAIGTAITAVTEGNRPNSIIYPPAKWSELQPYARFPMEIPEVISLNSLEYPGK